MRLDEFATIHLPALERDEARHNLMVAAINGAANNQSLGMRHWSFGNPGACAVQVPGRPIVIGDLNQAQCQTLAQDTCTLDYPAVWGPDETATWFTARATKLGLRFDEPMAQRIHALRDKPVYPGAGGEPRLAGANDLDLVVDWVALFVREAIPHETGPVREHIEKSVAEGRYLLWTAQAAPVSMAAIARRSGTGAAISMVYTPPRFRGRGYAGSVTAALVERVFAQGKTMACLFTDQRNPYSNRCYAKIGFRPVCDALVYPRIATRR